MELKGSLYHIINNDAIGDDIAGYDIYIDKCHPILRAHFPGQPIVPGTCLLKTLKELTELNIGKNIMMDSIKDVKFIRALTPDNTYHVGFTAIESHEYILKTKGFVRSATGEIYSKFFILYDIKQ